MRKLLNYINPIVHLGERNYSAIFPLLTMITIVLSSEFYSYMIAHDPMAVGIYAIFLFVALIIYFSFRSGIMGGFIATVITIAYYFYIIYTRHYQGQLLKSGIETTLSLAAVYILLFGIIGWLKQTIDKLIEGVSDERSRMEAVVQQLPVGVLITDNNGTLIQRNKKLDQILGLKIPLGFTIGKDYLNEAKIDGEIIHPHESPLAHALKSGRTIVGKEYLYERPDGKKMYLNVSATPIHRQDGDIIAAASIISDITSQKDLEARKEDFVNMASHELKTPITSMKIYVEYLVNKLDEFKDERTKKTLRSVKYQTERLQEIVSNLLDVSRLQTGKLSFNKENFDLSELVQETVDGLQAASNNQQLVFKQHKPVMVFADKFRIYQVLTNLITNAFKYSKPDTQIHVTVVKSDGKVTVSVKDTGIGVAKDQQKKIFDRLYQVEDDTKKTFAGFGMGLYISKEIIKRHRGKIWVESEINNGSTFFFELPLV